MKIRQKLFLGFLVIAILILMINYINFIVQKHLYVRFQEITQRELPGTIALVRLDAALYHALFHLNNYIFTGKEEEKKKVEDLLKEIEKYEVIHRVYHVEKNPSHLEMIEKNVEACIDLLAECILSKKTGKSIPEYYFFKTKLHKVLHNFTTTVKPIIQQHIEETRKITQQVRKEITQVNRLTWSIGIVILFIGLIWGIFVSYYVSRPLLALTKAAAQIGKGKLDTQIEVYSQDEIGELARAFNEMAKNLKRITVSHDAFAKEVVEKKRAEERLKASLREKEVLLKEVHHRVKNNMQVIYSLLSLQARYIKDKKAAEILKECQNRIRTMALVHESLYKSEDLANVDFSDYIKQLVNSLYSSHKVNSNKIGLKVEVENVPLGLEKAIPCGLIVNELVSNALKHAFPDGREGEIRISLRSVNKDEIELIVSDNGIGLPKDFDPEKTDPGRLSIILCPSN